MTNRIRECFQLSVTYIYVASSMSRNLTTGTTVSASSGQFSIAEQRIMHDARTVTLTKN